MDLKELAKITPEEARYILWRQGEAWQFLLDDLQKKVITAYKDSNNGREIIMVYSRQSGKSYCLYTLAYCLCIANPNFHVTYVAPTLKMAKKITKMTYREVTMTAPSDCLANFNTQDSEYVFKNGSKIELVGFNAGQVDDSRGGKSHLVIVDECGFMDEHNFDYGVASVLYPKLNSTKGSMIMCSTLPTTQAHPYWQRVLKAKVDNRLVEGTIYDCPRYTKEDIAKFADRVGGFDSISFKREYMNELITDEDSAVIPEASTEKMHVIVKEVKRPPYFDTYVSMDIGFRDYTAVLFGYYDFIRSTVVIEDELIIKGGKQSTTSSFSELIKEKEKQLWGSKKPYLRVADNNNLILLNELTTDYGLTFMPTAKDNREAAINKLRLLVQKNQIVIHPRCTYLIQQMQHATWNSKRTDFTRDVSNGHQDALVSCIYMCRNIQFQRNPYPDDAIMLEGAFYPFGDQYQPKDEFQRFMMDMFNPFKKR